MQVVDTFSHIPTFTDTYSHELDQIAAAAERAAERVERETAKLARLVGSPKYAPQEHDLDGRSSILSPAGTSR